MAVRSLLGIALALASGCTGNLIPGVPLDDAGDEYTSDDAAATAVIVAPEAGTKGPSASASRSDGGRQAADSMDAGASAERDAGGSAPPRSSGDARAPSAEPRDAAKPAEAGPPPTPRSDAGSPPPSGMRDLSADPGKFLGAPRCDKAGALLCDDFESEAVGSAPDVMVWSAPFGNVPKVDATRAARGTKSLYFELAAGLPGHIEERKTFPMAGGTLYGRMFIWLDALPTAPAFANWTLVAALGSENPSEVRLGAQLDPGRDNANYFGLGSDHGPSGDWFTAGQEPESKVRARDWVCVEWMFKASNDTTQVWIDGKEQTSLKLTASQYRAGEMEAGKRFEQPIFDRLRIGYWLYQAEGQPSPAKLWVDEVVVDDARIGCAL